MNVFLDGPINVGKSTVGALLAGGLSLKQVISFALADAAELTNLWVGRGFHIVVSWPTLKHGPITWAAARGSN